MRLRGDAKAFAGPAWRLLLLPAEEHSAIRSPEGRLAALQAPGILHWDMNQEVWGIEVCTLWIRRKCSGYVGGWILNAKYSTPSLSAMHSVVVSQEPRYF